MQEIFTVSSLCFRGDVGRWLHAHASAVLEKTSVWMSSCGDGESDSNADSFVCGLRNRCIHATSGGRSARKYQKSYVPA